MVLKTGYLHAKGWNWTFILYHMQKSTQLMKNLSIIPTTVKLLKENTGEKLLDICLGNGFLTMTSKVQTRNTKLEKWDCIKWKIFHIAKEIKSQPIAFNSFWKGYSHVKSYHRNKRKQIKPKVAGGNF